MKKNIFTFILVLTLSISLFIFVDSYFSHSASACADILSIGKECFSTELAYSAVGIFWSALLLWKQGLFSK